MAHRVESVTAVLPPEYRIIMVAGGDTADLIDPDFAQDRLCYAGDDILYLMSASDRLHDVQVTLEAWDGRPPDEPGDDPPEALEEIELLLSDGTAHVSGMLEFPVSERLRIGAPGRYRARVSAVGREAIRRLPRGPLTPGTPPVERFVVQFWPAVASGGPVGGLLAE
jgi:hypothetical protein